MLRPGKLLGTQCDLFTFPKVDLGRSPFETGDQSGTREAKLWKGRQRTIQVSRLRILWDLCVLLDGMKAAVFIELMQALSKGVFCKKLEIGVDRGLDPEAIVIGLVAKLLEHLVTNNFGDVRQIQIQNMTVEARRVGLIQSHFLLRLINVIELPHPMNHVIAPGHCSVGIHDWIEGGRCLGETCNHGDLG